MLDRSATVYVYFFFSDSRTIRFSDVAYPSTICVKITVLSVQVLHQSATLTHVGLALPGLAWPEWIGRCQMATGAAGTLSTGLHKQPGF